MTKEKENFIVRRWTDQPEILEDGVHLCYCKTDEQHAQVIVNPETQKHYVTVGNLFGSQTVEVGSAHDAFRLIDMLSDAKGRGLDPEMNGFKWVDNNECPPWLRGSCAKP